MAVISSNPVVSGPMGVPGGQPMGGLDPLLDGFSADSAAHGANGGGAGWEAAFAKELAAALGNPNAEKSNVNADQSDAADQPIQDTKSLNRQNLPDTAMLKDAVLVSFAAVNQAVANTDTAESADAVGMKVLQLSQEIAQDPAALLETVSGQSGPQLEFLTQDLVSADGVDTDAAALANAVQVSASSDAAVGNAAQQALAAAVVLANARTANQDATLVNGSTANAAVSATGANAAGMGMPITSVAPADAATLSAEQLQMAAEQAQLTKATTAAASAANAAATNSAAASTKAAVSTTSSDQAQQAILAAAQQAQDATNDAAALMNPAVTEDGGVTFNTAALAQVGVAATTAQRSTANPGAASLATPATSTDTAQIVATDVQPATVVVQTDAADVALSAKLDTANAGQTTNANASVLSAAQIKAEELDVVVDQGMAADAAVEFANVSDNGQVKTALGNVTISNTASEVAGRVTAAQNASATMSVNAASETTSSENVARTSAQVEARIEAARASLGSGPLNVEVLRLTRQGGGRAVLEVTPPNQGPIRLDLQLDGAGKANLLVEGLTESMRARLETSAQFLRQDMASMGLALNLEMRERSDNSAAQAFAQGFGQSRDQGGSQRQASSGRVTSVPIDTRAPSAASNSDGINLYA